MHSLTLVSLLLPTLSSLLHVAAEPCIAMDTSFNLLVFGVNGKDFNAGTQDTWTSGSAADITAANRPPFDGTNTTCYLSQFNNAVYVLNADSSDNMSVFIYDVGGKSWSKQSVNQPQGTKTVDTTNFKAILDHDTNVFYAMSKGEVFFLDMTGSSTTANSSAISWVDVGAPAAWGDLSSYEPTMALAQNHVHFIGVPGLSPGQADIFVIHFSFFQPEAQSYGANFPETHGQTASFFQKEGVQQEFAFIPDDGSATYVVNVESNTTQTLKGPDVKDAKAQYFAGITSLVQLSPAQGALQFLPYTQGSDNSGATWTKIASVTVPAGSDSSNSSANGTASGSASGTATGSGASQTGNSNGAERTAMNAVGTLLLGGVALAAVLL
ncbi:uncharacterized protein FOMMEDRAFT_131910 [Fomitiporia mediterranea MF3/22]|uniref:uncharacterized protein n=1 Tax=Fomitiporia mediterranea (strain MF3/22) TaxID=694068 RepID=UPI00044090A2|nr:uncharacterized protein FOMMEDRAFT_131910 [Fomitiporia mediterranea MF3/22]EJD05357.1 hypothetical protein FOMMEDRAFT_131910 [Fomitiporia mediterranea MF3/22]